MFSGVKMLLLEDLVEITNSIEQEFSDISENENNLTDYVNDIFYFEKSSANTYKLYRYVSQENTESNLNNILFFNVELPYENSELDHMLSQGDTTLAQVKECTSDQVRLVIITFPFGIEPFGDLHITLDGKHLKKARKNGINVKNEDELANNLADIINIRVGTDDFFVFKKKEAAKQDFEETDEEKVRAKSFETNIEKQNTVINETEAEYEDEESVGGIDYSQKKNLFSIYGKGLSLPVKLFIREDVITDRRLEVCNISVRNKEKSYLHLAKGKVIFGSGDLTDEQRRKLEILTEEGNTYLSKWEEFCNIETEILISNAIDFGELKYTNYEKTPNGYRFYFEKDNIKKISDGVELVQFDVAPNFSELQNIDNKAALEAITKSYRGLVSHKIINSNKKYIELVYKDEDPQPGNEGSLCLSISGDIHQKNRQLAARERISEDRAANPHLRELIEPIDYPLPKQTGRKLEPLSDFVKNKIFKNAPTETQIKAIDIALNTPDIALIQGPPGTGKTSVITAIIERLCEEYDKTKEIKGSILVSSFQQDAVENVVSRLDFFSAIKLGKRNTETDTDSYEYKRIDKWIRDTTKTIRDKNPQLKENEEVVALNELCSNYYINPSKENCKSIFECIDSLPLTALSSDLRNKCKVLYGKIFNKQICFEREESDEILEQVNRLRTNKLSFFDDGAKNCFALYDSLQKSSFLSQDDLFILKKGSEWNKTLPLDFLPELVKVKDKLLDSLIEPSSVFENKPNMEVIAICEKINQELIKKNKSSDSEEQILAEFLFEFQSNPLAIKKAISQYCCIYAATTQQSVSQDVINLKQDKKESGDFSDLSYDTVIIDEAARASPADLLIPMTQAKHRIILVGDHKQLPHMIDQELEKRVLEDNKENLDYLNKSLFEYLKNRLQKLTAKDGVQRTITLDAQYRTHPILGKFISDNFYEKDGEGFKSPLGKEYFQQNLRKIAGKPAVWINMPYSSDRDIKRTAAKSYERKAEAEYIAKSVKVWIDSEEGKNLSFGIISFYSGQVEAIKTELAALNIMKKTKSGFDISEEYRYINGSNSERLRVGSVDAFQGKEFDVIILSMVRTLPEEKINELTKLALNQHSDSIGRKVFGFMTFMNRLNVSMSRQKKVLIVFGDGVLASSKLAEICVKPLYNFFNLCGKEGVVFRAK